MRHTFRVFYSLEVPESAALALDSRIWRARPLRVEKATRFRQMASPRC
jgi:hypothetical protein